MLSTKLASQHNRGAMYERKLNKMSIKAKAVASNLGSGEHQIYRLVVSDQKKVTEDVLITRLATKMGVDKSNARFWCDNMRAVIKNALLANEAIDLGFLFGKLYVTGSLQRADQQPTKADNPVKAVCTVKGDLAAAIAALEVINDTETVAIILYEVTQDGISEVNRIESASARVVLTGSNVKIDTSKEDEGVFLEDEDGARIANGVISYSDSSVIYVTFPTLTAAKNGTARLVILGRNGQDAETYAVDRITRNVTIAIPEEA